MRTLTLLLVVLANGCAHSVSTHARATAGHIGCPAERIELSQLERDGGGPESWVASCGFRNYACSSNRDPSSAHAHVVCSELGRPRHAWHRHRRY